MFENLFPTLLVSNKGQTQTGDKEQIINVTDLICEGPIKGLVGEESGIYLNDSPAVDAQFQGSYTSDGKGDAFFPEITFTGASSAGTSTNGFSAGEGPSDENRVIQLQNYREATITVSSVVNLAGVSNIFVTRATGTFTAADWDTSTGIAGERRHTLSTEGYELAGSFKYLTATTGQFMFSSSLADGGFDATKTYSLSLKQGFLISSIQRTGTNGTGVTLRNSVAPVAGTYEFKILPAGLMEESGFYAPGLVRGFNKVDEFTAQFVDGSLFQNALEPINGVGGAVSVNGPLSNITRPELKQLKQTIATTKGITILDSGGYPQGQSTEGDGAAGVTVLPPTAFGLDSPSKIAEADEISFTIQYPALQAIRNRKATKHNTFAFYEIKIFKDGAIADWTKGINCFPSYGKHIVHEGNTSTGTSFQHVIGLNQYRPFTTFEVQVVRLTRHVGLRVARDGTRDGNDDLDYWTTSSNASITQAGAIIRDKFRYPYASVASLTFSSKKFNGVPKRSYDLQGLKIQVPTTYTPREYSANKVATYTGFWGGAFKDELFYTDNPAWVFYDIVTNNRYGAGQWIKAGDIDKYALYRIAKYCDELVPDGKGGTEPRFRANLLLTKATDVYKVLKDVASIFTGMIYWMDGQVTAVQDTPADPIYTFSKSNVIEGQFSYESTGSKTRANQVVVTWNDPTANYEPVPVIVEDRENIVRKGRIISETAVAFGATSEGQAIRYGRWKLWTALNQTEVVSFTTGIQGTYIKPGDIINVQDADRYGVPYSGRISSYTPGTLVLDRAVAFNSGSAYTLSTLVTEPAAFYAGYEAVTIGSTTYNRGERITQAYVDADETGTGALALTTLNTEARATNAFANSAGTAPLEITWQEYSYVQSQSITNPAATTATLSVTTDVAVATETIWALTEVSNAQENLGSAKKYRVMGVSKQEETNYAITAVEYYDEKFDAVDTDYELGSVPVSIYPEKEPESVPAPANIYVVLESDAKTPGEELRVFWDKPDNYEFIAGYELSHTAPDIDSPISITGTSQAFTKLASDIYTFKVRTVSSKGNKSPYTSINYRVEDIFDENIPRVQEGIPKGVLANSTFLLTSGTELAFEKDPASVVSNGASLSTAKVIDGADAIDVSSLDYDTEYSVLFADSTLDLAYYDTTTLPEIPHWVRLAGTENISTTNYALNKWTSVGTSSGTVSCAANSTTVTGVGTSWLTTLKTRDIVIFGASVSAALTGKKGALVTSILSDTEIRIDKTFSTAQTSVGLFRRTFRPDTNNDSIFATISKTQGSPDTYSLEKFITLDPSLELGKYVAVETSSTLLQYEASSPNNQVSIPSNITCTTTAVGFVSPLFKVSTLSSGLDGTVQTTFNSPNSGSFGYTFTLDANGAVDYLSGVQESVTVQVVESTRQGDIFEGVGTIPKITAGADGASVTGDSGARTANFIIYYNTGSASSPGNPTATSYSFVNNTFTSLSTGWSTSAPQAVAGTTTSNYWYANVNVKEGITNGVGTGDTTGTGSMTIGPAFVGLGFTGLVTFTSLSTSGSTAINGANITTGTINANRISLSGKNITDLTNNAGYTDDTAADAAQADADTAQGRADSAFNLAGGKNKTFYLPSTATPASPIAGDIWVQTDKADLSEKYKVFTTAWVSMNPSTVGGWNLTASSLYSGTVVNATNAGFTSGAGHISINSGGSIHTPKFYVNQDGNAGFKGTVTIGNTDLTEANTLDQVQGAFTGNTTISGGTMILSSDTNGSITLDSTANQILIKEGTTIRVKLGKLT